MLNKFRQQYLSWDIANQRIYDKLFANSGDINGRKLIAKILDDVQETDLTGSILSLGWNSGKVQGMDVFTPIDIETGLFELYYTDDMLTNIGKLEASLILTMPDSNIESLPFEIEVKKGVINESATAESSFTTLVQALIKVENLKDELIEFKEVQERIFDDLWLDKSVSFDEMQSERATGFDEWFENLQEELDDSQVVNLQNQITRLKADKELITITHELDDYPTAIVTSWESGGIPETVPVTITYPSTDEIKVKVPLPWKLPTPTVVEESISPLTFLLTEGTKSMRIKLVYEDPRKVMTPEEKDKLGNIEEGAQKNLTIASKAQAETGTTNDVSMTPLRTKESIARHAMMVVNHGTSSTVARPVGAIAVYWVGMVEPRNAKNGDLWIGGL